MAKKYWLMKSEPNDYSIDHLKKEKKCLWDGIRNYQARNFMMKKMTVGDEVLFYHSNAAPPGVVGLACISAPAQADPTAFDKKSKYYDEKSSPEKPRWFCVEVKFTEKFKCFVSLEDIRNNKKLQDMMVIKKGMRLSIQPVKKNEFELITKIGRAEV